MKVIGIRNSTSCVRIAILDASTSSIDFINKDSEHRLIFPKDKTTETQKLVWARSEFLRIFSLHKDASYIAIKQNENNSRGNYPKYKLTAYLDAAAILAASTEGIPVDTFVYTNIGGVKSNTVVPFVESRFPAKSKTYWNKQIADAVLVALKKLDQV